MGAPIPDPEVGTVFGYLTVAAPAERYGEGLKHKRIRCLCKCGKEKTVDKTNLLRGRSTSCGCFNAEKNVRVFTTHGKRKEPIYAVWNMMRQRCQVSTCGVYADYGGRGITVCEKWQTFEGFYEDMGDQPFEGAMLERKDNDGPYSKDNCVWATRTEQNRNKRNNVYYDFYGEALTLKEVSEVSGVNLATLRSRVYAQGLNIYEAVSKA